MKASDKKLNLLDLVDKKFLQEFQDNFSKTTGFASVTLSEDGYITDPSNFTDFCLFMKGHEKSNELCAKCDAERRKTGFENKKPFIYKCHAGLTIFVVPIVVNNQTIALMAGGQTFTQDPDIEFYKKLAEDCKINEKEYLNKVKKIKKTTVEKIESASKLLFQFANSISNTVHQNYELKETNNRERLLRKIIEKIRSSLDLDETLTYICEETAKAFNVQRVAIAQFSDANKNERITFLRESKINDDILGYGNMNNRHAIANWLYDIFTKTNIFSLNNINNDNIPIFVRTSFSKIGIKSLLCGIIKSEGNTWGMITLSEYYNYRDWTNEEKSLLETISDQVYIAVNQADLYGTLKQNMERETLLRKIISTIRESLDLNTTFNIICSEINRITGANRVTIFQSLEAYENHSIRGECKKSKEIKSVSQMDVKERVKVFKYLKSSVFKTNKPLFINNLGKSDVPEYVKDFYINLDAKSLAVFPIKKGKDEWGILTISHIDHYKHWNQQEIDFVETVIEQVYIAINQAELYSKMQQQNAREKAILTNLPFLVWLKDKEGRFLATNEEFAKACGVSADNLVGKTDYDIWPKELADGYVQDDKDVMQKRITKSTEELIQGEDKPRWHETYKTPIYNDKGEVVGTTGFARDITERMENQEKIIKAAERETLLRKIIETVRSTLDINTMKKQIVTQMGKAFNVERCVIQQFNSKTDKFDVIDEFSEYKSLDSLKSYVGIDIEIPGLKFFRDMYVRGEEMFIPDWQQHLDELEEIDSETKEWIKSLDIKSDYVFPIIFGEQLLASLYMTYTHEKKYFSEEDLNDIRLLTKQIAIGFHQAQLYEAQKLAAERERISRNIVEILRSSIDKSIIKKLFVKNLGKFFNADRVFLSEYDAKANMLMPVDASSEYLSNADEKTSTNYDFTSSEFDEHVERLLEKREIRVENFEEFVKQNHGLDEKMIEHYRDANTKSSYAFPIVYQNHIMGAFAIQFTHQIVKLSDEDLSRIRSICTQAGIALYHANLYEKAKECELSRHSFMLKVSEQIEQPVHEIMDISKLLSQNDFEHFIEVEYLNKIVISCNHLLKLTTKMDEE